MISPARALSLLISASGNARLAAARATSSDPTSPPITEAELLFQAAQDPQALHTLQQQTTLLALINTLEAIRLTHSQYIQSLPDLRPHDLARAYPALLNSLTAFLVPSQTPNPQALPNTPTQTQAHDGQNGPITIEDVRTRVLNRLTSLAPDPANPTNEPPPLRAPPRARRAARNRDDGEDTYNAS